MTTCRQLGHSGLDGPSADSLPTRHSLLSRIKDVGDNTSWSEFFETYWKLIYNFARKTGLTNEEAQEVVQDTVIRVCSNIGKFNTGKEHGSFKAWLLQQTRWRIADQFRKRAKFYGWASVGTALASAPAGGSEEQTGTATVNRIADPAGLELEKTWNAEWESHLLRVATERIKIRVCAKQFQVFDLHVIQGLSARETAQALGSTVMAVHMATSRVRHLFRREIAILRAAKPSGS